MENKETRMVIIDILNSIECQLNEGVQPGIEEVSELHQKAVDMFRSLMNIAKDDDTWNRLDKVTKDQILDALDI